MNLIMAAWVPLKAERTEAYTALQLLMAPTYWNFCIF